LGALLLRGGEGRGSGEGREGEGLKPPQSKFSGYIADGQWTEYASPTTFRYLHNPFM